ncbi:MAG: HmuY family protein [Hoylesella buccalis]
MKRVCLWMLGGLMLLLAGCATEDAVGRGVQDVSLTVDDVPNRWTYVSLSAHEVVEAAPWAILHEDALWMLRTDWDIAFCNGMIRTNSGSSGKGKGGITWTPVDYDDVDNLRAPSYQTDTRQTVTVKSVEIE